MFLSKFLSTCISLLRCYMNDKVTASNRVIGTANVDDHTTISHTSATDTHAVDAIETNTLSPNPTDVARSSVPGALTADTGYYLAFNSAALPDQLVTTTSRSPHRYSIRKPSYYIISQSVSVSQLVASLSKVAYSSIDVGNGLLAYNSEGD